MITRSTHHGVACSIPDTMFTLSIHSNSFWTLSSKVIATHLVVFRENRRNSWPIVFKKDCSFPKRIGNCCMTTSFVNGWSIVFVGSTCITRLSNSITRWHYRGLCRSLTTKMSSDETLSPFCSWPRNLPETKKSIVLGPLKTVLGIIISHL